MSKNLTIPDTITEEEMLNRAIEGEEEWLSGAEFDDEASINFAELIQIVEAYGKIIDTTIFND